MAGPDTTRFAPSPTGLLHLGHAYSAVLARRLAGEDGRFLLRIEDLDGSRCRPEYGDAILQDLGWLGLSSDGAIVCQSARRTAHRQALRQLQDMGLVYPCFCTRSDIAEAAGAPHGPSNGAPTPYPGTCRHLPPAVAARRAASEPHALRLDVAAASDRVGPLFRIEGGTRQPADPLPMGDPVLARKDIGVGYLLASVVDDAAMAVTLVVRGRDLAPVAPQQRLLQELLHLPAPRYLHHRLLLAADGRRLAKRDRAETLAALRQRGVDGRKLAARLAALPTEGEDLFFRWPPAGDKPRQTA